MSLLQECIRELLAEKKLRGQKDKRTLYHINMRPARPQPKIKAMQTWDDTAGDPDDPGDFVDIPDTQNWQRHWLDSPVKSGVFLTPNPGDIAMNHGRSGNVYTYKVPEWVIDKSGGLHRYDRGSELLIPEDVWNEAGDEIEFLGKSMSQKQLWDSVESSSYGRGHHRPAKKPSWMDKEELKKWEAEEASRFNLAGLRSTKHPEAAIKMMKPDEVKRALARFEKVYAQEGPPELYKGGPRDKKGIVIPFFGQQPSLKDKELIAMLKKRQNESVVRDLVRELLSEQNIQAAGMCFPFAYQKAEEWFEAHFTKASRGRRLKRHPDLNDKSKFKVVHGTITDKWEKPVKPVVHGWVEMGDLVFDDQTQHTKPDGVNKEFYYEMFQPEVYREFTAEEAIVNCAMKGGEGPWDDDLWAQMQQRDAWQKT